MQVRLITENDVEPMIALARVMHSESPVFRPYPFHDHVMRTWFYSAIQNPKNFFCAVTESQGDITGAIMACAMPMLFSETYMAAELGFYVLDAHRGGKAALLLVKAFEDWAKERNCLTMDTSVSVGINNDKAVSFYKKMGFRDLGQMLRKELFHV